MLNKTELGISCRVEKSTNGDREQPDEETVSGCDFTLIRADRRGHRRHECTTNRTKNVSSLVYIGCLARDGKVLVMAKTCHRYPFLFEEAEITTENFELHINETHNCTFIPSQIIMS